MREKIIELIATQFAKDRKKYDQIVPITTARVPIVKFYMRPWRMQCDISLENKLALRNTRLLAAYTKIDPRVPKLGCALKRLAKSCDMCDAAAGSLSSYAYVLMLLHYLQTVTPPIVPVLQQVCTEISGITLALPCLNLQ
jgi:terminal uridylyltransferase